MSIFWLYNLQELIISKTKNSSIKLSAGWNVFFYVQFIREKTSFTEKILKLHPILLIKERMGKRKQAFTVVL